MKEIEDLIKMFADMGIYASTLEVSYERLLIIKAAIDKFMGNSGVRIENKMAVDQTGPPFVFIAMGGVKIMFVCKAIASEGT